jgi:hypothetical protein
MLAVWGSEGSVSASTDETGDEKSFLHIGQAVRMVAAQASVGLDEAADRLVEEARATGQSVDTIADQVVNGMNRFGPRLRSAINGRRANATLRRWSDESR